jgi:hypothetical protein
LSGVGNIIAIAWLRWKSFFKPDLLKLRLLLAKRGTKRALMLAPLLLALTFAALTDPSSQAISKAIRKKITAALKDPLALFAQRSPGGRSHASHLIKIKGPHERVLSTVRERPASPAAENPLLDTPPAILDIPPAAVAPPGPIPVIDNLPELPPAINPPSFPPSFPPFFPGGIVPGGPPGGPSTPPPSGPPPPVTPPITPPGSPPENPPLSPPSTPPTTIIPEPATWTMMGAGLAAAVSARRRMRKQRALIQKR